MFFKLYFVINLGYIWIRG